MIYANAKQWYDIHPIVGELIDEVAASLAQEASPSTS